MTSEIRTRTRRRSSVAFVRVVASPLRPSAMVPAKPPTPTLLDVFLAANRELEEYRGGRSVLLDGQTLSIAAVTAAARYGASAQLDGSPTVKNRVERSRAVLEKQVEQRASVYGVTTGFGGSADTRTDRPLILGHALLQLLQAGTLPSSTKVPDILPLVDPMNMAMPESFVRGAMLIRINQLLRGHSAVRFELLERMNSLLTANITPVVPLRGSISASGDLQPLSYVAGLVAGYPSIRAFDGPAAFGMRRIVSAPEALKAHNIDCLPLASKEHLGILNGTAFSASVAALALNDAVHLALLAHVCTAMGVEALAGSKGSFDPFIHDIARPHPGQIESARLVWNLLEGSKFATLPDCNISIDDDEGTLRQDRYSLRTAPQFLGPQLEDLLVSLETITRECNSTTDNPLVDGETGKIHNGGNFQAMAVTNVMEKTRLGLHHFGKLLFSQCTELLNPTMNRGLPPSLAATDPSLNFNAKGLDIATAAYVAELGYRAAPVSTHIQSAEMHNQSVNSLALISGRATVDSLEILSQLMASYIYILCQALDLRAMHHELVSGFNKLVKDELNTLLGPHFHEPEFRSLTDRVCEAMQNSLESTSTMDAHERMIKVAASSSPIILEALVSSSCENPSAALAAVQQLQSNVAQRAEVLLNSLRRAYLFGERGPAPASPFLNKTRPIYEYVRRSLGVKMHGAENYTSFVDGVLEDSIGANVSLIFEAIRDGKMQPIVVGLFA